MSKYFQPAFSSKRQLEIKWLNIVYQAHDVICSCDTPSEHLKDLINKETCRHFKDAATTTETGGTPEKEEDTFDEGDLEKLFSKENDVDEG